MVQRILEWKFQEDLEDMSTEQPGLDDITPATEEAIDEEWRNYFDDNRPHFHADELPEWLRCPADY